MGMEILLWIVVIMDWFLLIYLPVVGLYGLIRLQIDSDPLNTIRAPFLGMGNKLSLKKGILIWMIQLMMLGVVLMQYAMWHRGGECPFILMW